MELILWRHAEAEAGEPDLGRKLTSKGQKQADRVGAWLDKQLPDSCRILVSPADRAQQTARAMKRKFKTVESLGPGADIAAILAAANWPESRDPVMVVGHQPVLGRVASFLVSGEDAEWSMKKGALWWLTNRDRNGDSRIVVRCVTGPDFV